MAIIHHQHPYTTRHEVRGQQGAGQTLADDQYIHLL
jgi:hypothetical protein